MEVRVEQLLNARNEEMEKQEHKVPVSSEIAKKEEVVKILEPEATLEMTREPEHSQPPQTPLDQKVSTTESVIKRYEEEMKRCWEDQQTSSMKELLSQMLSAKKGLEE
ncbi:hypothetical protein AHAS_Ahas15G0190600 [Arachis hypogaea]